ncbi:hypothetical protein JZ751_014943 [Albula glossodonta]|uniref:Uncharacterized protein n=1 Tax=Albula glossodonta TaxID=121402 RepID=A0A8T2MY33_9TELE|nr:hypothetical protein JZ751_014943 [Albula glossodonta]
MGRKARRCQSGGHCGSLPPGENPDRLRRVDSNRKSRSFSKQPSTGDYYKALGSDTPDHRGTRTMAPNEEYSVVLVAIWAHSRESQLTEGQIRSSWPLSVTSHASIMRSVVMTPLQSNSSGADGNMYAHSHTPKACLLEEHRLLLPRTPAASYCFSRECPQPSERRCRRDTSTPSAPPTPSKQPSPTPSFALRKNNAPVHYFNPAAHVVLLWKSLSLSPLCIHGPSLRPPPYHRSRSLPCLCGGGVTCASLSNPPHLSSSLSVIRLPPHWLSGGVAVFPSHLSPPVLSNSTPPSTVRTEAEVLRQMKMGPAWRLHPSATCRSSTPYTRDWFKENNSSGDWDDMAGGQGEGGLNSSPNLAAVPCQSLMGAVYSSERERESEGGDGGSRAEQSSRGENLLLSNL